MAVVRTYNYSMGFKINNVAIPDPAVFNGKASALDTLGNRDATGLVHRNMVATKHPLKLEYHNITFAMIESIMAKLTGETFRFTYPDPQNGLVTITAYVGDREWDTAIAPGAAQAGNTDWKLNWIGNLSFSVIEC